MFGVAARGAVGASGGAQAKLLSQRDGRDVGKAGRCRRGIAGALQSCSLLRPCAVKGLIQQVPAGLPWSN